MHRLLMLFGVIGHLLALEVIPERIILEYENKKYLNGTRFYTKRTSRESPYYLNLESMLLSGFGDNATISLSVWENVSGRHIQTPLQLIKPLCQFLEEPYIGKMVYKYIQPNMSCPFQPGKLSLKNVDFQFHNFPHYLPFTYSSLEVRARVLFNAYWESNKEKIFSAVFDVKIIQKLKKRS